MTLPPFRALLVVDAEQFSRNRDIDLPPLHTEIRQVVARACERSGLGDAWRAVRFRQSTGDGVLATFPAEAAPCLIHPFVDRLQDALAESASSLRARGLRLRLRVALHIGLVDDEHPVTAGVSAATNEVCRLLDSDPLRAALRDSDPDVTFTAAIVSAEVFEALVRGGHTGLRPSQFTQVRAKVKQFDRPAFVYVPAPSSRACPDDDPPPDAGPTPGRAPESGSAPGSDSRVPDSPPSRWTSFGNVTVTGNTGQNVIGSVVNGDIRQERP